MRVCVCVVVVVVGVIKVFGWFGPEKNDMLSCGGQWKARIM